MILSTALSDGALAVATFFCAFLLLRARYAWCAIWMCAIALAALCGTLRFAGVDGLESLHLALSRWAAMVALPGFCWAMARQLRTRRPVRAGEALAIAAGLNLLLLVAPRADVVTAVGACALLVAMVGAAALYRSRRDVFLMIAWAIALYAIAGLWVGTEGQLGPMPRVDVYHYVLAAANLLFAFALRREARAPA